MNHENLSVILRSLEPICDDVILNTAKAELRAMRAECERLTAELAGSEVELKELSVLIGGKDAELRLLHENKCWIEQGNMQKRIDTLETSNRELAARCNDLEAERKDDNLFTVWKDKPWTRSKPPPAAPVPVEVPHEVKKFLRDFGTEKRTDAWTASVCLRAVCERVYGLREETA